MVDRSATGRDQVLLGLGPSERGLLGRRTPSIAVTKVLEVFNVLSNIGVPYDLYQSHGTHFRLLRTNQLETSISISQELIPVISLTVSGIE